MSTGFKILVIEDEFLIANQLKTFLESEGFIVVGPTDSYEGSIVAIQKELPDLIIADIRLNDDVEAGIRISKYVHDNYYIPLIFLSSISDKETIDKAKKTNPNTFLVKPKPLDKVQLLTTVHIALPSTKSTQKLKSIDFKGKDIKFERGKQIDENDTREMITRIINTNDIVYIETNNHNVKNTLVIRFVNRDSGFMIRGEMDTLIKRLPANFLRVHNSFIVNMIYVNGYKLPQTLICNKAEVPMGEKYRDSVLDYINSRH